LGPPMDRSRQLSAASPPPLLVPKPIAFDPVLRSEPEACRGDPGEWGEPARGREDGDWPRESPGPEPWLGAVMGWGRERGMAFAGGEVSDGEGSGTDIAVMV